MERLWSRVVATGGNVLELYDAAEEPVFTNDTASVEPVETVHCYGDAGTLYYQFHKALEVLNATRSW